MTERDFLERVDAHIAEMRRHNDRAGAPMEEIREELRLNRDSFAAVTTVPTRSAPERRAAR